MISQNKPPFLTNDIPCGKEDLMRFHRFLCLTLACLGSFRAAASQPVELRNDRNVIELGPAIEYREDPEGQLTLDEIRVSSKQDWKASGENVPNFGFTRSAYWLKFTIKGDETQSRSMLLQIAYPALDELELYIPQADGNYVVKKTGDHQLFQERDVDNRNFIFKLDIKGETTYYLRSASTGSMKIPLKLFDPEHFQEIDEKQVLEIGFFCGIIIAMLLYNSFLAVTIRDITYVYYIGYIGLLLIFSLSLNGMAFQYLWPRNIWLANFSIPLTMYGSACFALFFSSRFLRTPRLVPVANKFITGLKVWALIGIALMPFVPYKFTTQSSTAHTLVLNFVLMATGLILVKRGERSARFYMIAFAAIWCGMAAKALQTLGIIPVSYFTENGVFIGSMMEVILLSLALGDKIQQKQKAAQQKIESLNSNLADTIKSLDAKVEEQTSEIKSMLGNIQQGIFTVKIENGIPVLNADFSEHLTEILGTKDLAGKPLMTCVFSHSNLSQDQLSMVESVMVSCLGEPLIAYEINVQQLPSEFILKDSSGLSKTIEIDWCPVLSKNGATVQSFLVTMRDVSSYRILQAQSREQEDELRRTSELLNLPHATFLRFVQLFHELIQENRRLIATQRARDPEVLKIMFINMHTLKGAARQMGLTGLTSKIHVAEQIFSDLTKDERIAWNGDIITQTLDDCDKALQRYIDINQMKLGRSMTADDMSVSRSALESVIRFFRQLSGEALSLAAHQELKQLNQNLIGLVYHSSEKVLNDILKHAHTLAKDLHKAEPEIRIESVPVNLTVTGEDLLRKVFLHLIRNSLDHGIEMPDERVAKGKPASGQIQVVMDRPTSDSMRICYRDDGRGINIARLKQIARDLGLLKQDELSDSLKIANTIFADGISTSKSVTDISGRGVGMGAIKEYVERLGGSIELKLYTERMDSGFLPFELILHAPSDKLVA
jgi:signal transduction histidine kinase